MAFPTIVRRAPAVGPTSNATTWTPTWTFGTNTAISSGDVVRWIVIVSTDGNTVSLSTAATGWINLKRSTDAGSTCSGHIFYQDTTGAYAAGASPPFPFTSSASEQFTAIMVALKASSGATLNFIEASPTASDGSSTNSDPPTMTNGTGASRNVYTFATRSGDSTVVPSAITSMTGYSNLLNAAAGGTGGASTSIAERQVTIASGGTENPGVFTVASEQWVSYTIGVYESAVAAPSKYLGARTRTNAYLGSRTDSVLNVGPTILGWT